MKDIERAEEQNKYWQEQFMSILGDSNAQDVSYGIPYLVAQITPLPQTRNEHERQTRKINALANAIDDYVQALITKEIKQARIDELRLVLGQDMFKNPDPTEGQLSLHKRIENRLTTLNKD